MTYETISLIPQKTFSNTGVHSTMLKVLGFEPLTCACMSLCCQD
jgi:hypothetical protein